MNYTMHVTDPRGWRRELAEEWASIRQALRAIKGNYSASAILRGQLRRIEKTHAWLRECL